MSIDYVAGDDHIVTITINRPEARNSMDMEHFFQLRSAWDRFGEDDDAYVAIVTGVGKDFCVGADLKTYIPQITELQKKMQAGERPEIDGYRLDDGVKAVLRGVEALQADHRRRQRDLRGRRHGDARRQRHPRRHATRPRFGVMEPKRGPVRRRRHHRPAAPPDPLPGRHGVPAVRRPDPGRSVPSRWACSTRCAGRPT